MHRHASVVTAACVLLLFTATAGHAQAINPDISVIPRFLVQSNDGEKLADGKREFSRPDLSFQELEVAIQSYINPYAKADIMLTLPGPDIEASKLGVEEVYVTVMRGLPLDLNLRFGKYRVDYGKLNLMHPHAWPFISQPLSHERFFGEEGLNDLGVSASILLPTGDIYSKLTVDLLRGGSIGEVVGIEDTTGASPFYATSARLMGFFPLGDNSDLEAGLSAYTGIHDPYNRDRFWYTNIDFKYKYRPDAYTSFVVQGELLHNTRDASQDHDFQQFVDANGDPERRSIATSGLYLFADYQFMKVYSVGARFDWSQSPYSKEDKATGGAVFVGYYPVEETLGLRLEYQNTTTEGPAVTRSVNTIALQVLFSLGPHKAHPF